MTDNEIVKALECCSDTDCDNCPFEEQCRRNGSLADVALDLINRQNAEIETLREKYDRARCNLTAVLDERADHSEAIKEFAHILKHMMFEEDFLLCEPCVMADIIDDLVEEMVGENNG